MWTFIWLMVLLKVPIVALFLIVRWAVRQTPEAELGAGGDGGVGPRPSPRTPPRHPRSAPQRISRRGPHRGVAPASPARVRARSARRRLPHS